MPPVPFLTQAANRWLLHTQAEAYATRPSALLGLETPWGAWQVDQLVFLEGRRMQKLVDDGKNPFSITETQPRAFADPRGRKRIKTVRIKPDGTW